MSHAKCAWTDNYINSSFHEIFLHLMNTESFGIWYLKFNDDSITLRLIDLIAV